MRCPACGRDLTAIQAGSISVEGCVGGCGGLWFDQLELKRLDDPQETGGNVLLDIPVDRTTQVDPSVRRRCPKCPDVVMMQFFYSPKREARVDECPNCGGYWLDAGELRAIRSRYASEVERAAEAEALFQERFGDEAAALEARQQLQRGFHPITSVLRFLFPVGP